MPMRPLPMRPFWLAAVAAFAVDQASKAIVVHAMDLRNRLSMEVLPPLLNFRMGWNEGINFGLFAGSHEVMRWLLIGLAVGVSVALAAWARGLARPVARVAAGLVVGGALANALDRVLYGAVADFLNVSWWGIDNPFAFNLADVFIFAGAAGLILWGDRPAPDRAETP